jgi:hypothetical protein
MLNLILQRYEFYRNPHYGNLDYDKYNYHTEGET